MKDAICRLGDEELAVALVAAVDGDEQDGGAKGGEEGADGVELLGEDFENDEGEREEAEGGSHVGAFKGSLGGADFDEFVRSQHHRPGSMEPQMHVFFWMRPKHDGRARRIDVGSADITALDFLWR